MSCVGHSHQCECIKSEWGVKKKKEKSLTSLMFRGLGVRGDIPLSADVSSPYDLTLRSHRGSWRCDSDVSSQRSHHNYTALQQTEWQPKPQSTETHFPPQTNWGGPPEEPVCTNITHRPLNALHVQHKHVTSGLVRGLLREVMQGKAEQKTSCDLNV